MNKIELLILAISFLGIWIISIFTVGVSAGFLNGVAGMLFAGIVMNQYTNMKQNGEGK